jgi:hypothetical protein
MKRIQRDMSATLDHTEPAGAIASVLRTGTMRTVSRMLACGVATFGRPVIAATVGSVSLIPSGAKMRVRTKRSHDIPDARSTTAPATPYMTFWYSHFERNEEVGFAYRTRWITSAGEKLP